MPITALYKSEKNIRKIKNDLYIDFMILHKGFHESQMVSDAGKCHYILIGHDYTTHKIILNNNEIASSNIKNL